MIKMVMKIYPTVKPDICKFCGGNDFIKRGFDYTLQGKKQRFLCKECGRINFGIEESTEVLNPIEVLNASKV